MQYQCVTERWPDGHRAIAYALLYILCWIFIAEYLHLTESIVNYIVIAAVMFRSDHSTVLQQYRTKLENSLHSSESTPQALELRCEQDTLNKCYSQLQEITTQRDAAQCKLSEARQGLHNSFWGHRFRVLYIYVSHKQNKKFLRIFCHFTNSSETLSVVAHIIHSLAT